MQYNRSRRRVMLAAALGAVFAMTLVAAPSVQIAEASCGTYGYAFDGAIQNIGSLVAGNTTITQPTSTGQLQCRNGAASYLAQWVMVTQEGGGANAGYVQAGWDIEAGTNYQFWPFAQASDTNQGAYVTWFVNAPAAYDSTYSAHNYLGYCNGFWGQWAGAGYDPNGTWQSIVPSTSCFHLDWTGSELQEEEENSNTANYWGDWDGSTMNWAEYYCTGSADCNPTTNANMTTKTVTSGWHACESLATPTEQQMWDSRDYSSC